MIRIRELRTEKRILQAEFAKSLGVSQATLSYWERGEYQPDNEMLGKIADYFKVSIDYLLERTDIRRPGEISAASSTTRYEDLPPEALEELEKYKELLRLKYGKERDK